MALMYAIVNGYIGTAELLLVHGADPNIQGKVSVYFLFSFCVVMKYRFLSSSWSQQNGFTVLMCSSVTGHTATAEVLLVHGADPNIQNSVSIYSPSE